MDLITSSDYKSSLYRVKESIWYDDIFMPLCANLHFDFIVLFLEYDSVRTYIFMNIIQWIDKCDFWRWASYCERRMKHGQ